MPDHRWAALALFAFVSSITPGPNNLLATSSGARFGLRRTVPQVAGVTFGLILLLCLAASGVASLVVAHPRLAGVLAALGYGYLTWLSARLLIAAWRRPAARATAPVALRPMSFVQATLFQFANPKAWMMALSAASSFLADDRRSLLTIAAFCAVFAVINFPCVGAWAALGAHLQRWLDDPAAAWRSRAFDATMGITLLSTTVWMVALH